MIRYIIVSTISGILFGVLNGLINGNPFAQKLFQTYKPISKISVKNPALKGEAFCQIFGKGGKTVRENLQTICLKCNLGKSNLE